MNIKFTKSWSRCRGITLIEVMAGIALLGTLLVVVVMTTGKLTAKSYLADRRVEAYLVADTLLSGWWSGDETLPRNDSGAIEGHDDWQWRTSSVDAELAGIDAEVVTLEIVETGKDNPPLARIEILLKNAKNEDEKVDEETTQTQPATTQPAGGPDAG